jgi:superfamily II DNA or RNA helicase
MRFHSLVSETSIFGETVAGVGRGRGGRGLRKRRAVMVFPFRLSSRVTDEPCGKRKRSQSEGVGKKEGGREKREGNTGTQNATTNETSEMRTYTSTCLEAGYKRMDVL